MIRLTARMELVTDWELFVSDLVVRWQGWVWQRWQPEGGGFSGSSILRLRLSKKPRQGVAAPAWRMDMDLY